MRNVYYWKNERTDDSMWYDLVYLMCELVDAESAYVLIKLGSAAVKSLKNNKQTPDIPCSETRNVLFMKRLASLALKLGILSGCLVTKKFHSFDNGSIDRIY
jgi:hypothetical protein